MLIPAGTKFIAKGTKSLSLSARGKLMSSPWDQEVFVAQADYYDIYLKHERGSNRGLVVRFSRVRLLKYRETDTCTCPAYSHPHTRGRGKCQTPSETQ